MGQPWFRVKRYGYGAGLPCRWQGWAVLAAFLAVAVGSGALNAQHPLAHLAVILAATAALIAVAWRKSDAPWKWRWGQA